jgi:hypothetical protein
MGNGYKVGKRLVYSQSALLVLTHLWVCSLSLSLSLSEYEHFYFPSPAFGLYFFLPLSVRTSQCSISPISGLYLSLISNKPCVRVTLAARLTYFNNILESRGCSSHPYTRSLWVTL